MTVSTIKIAAFGDIAFVGRYDRESSTNVFAEIEPIFRQHDLVIGNLESPIICSGKPVPGKCTLKANEAWGLKMKNSGLDVLSLANNHLMDYGPEGLLSTIDCLGKVEIQWVGAGRNIDEANAPLYINKAGYRIAIIARTSVFVASPSYAGPNTPGVARFNQEELVETLRTCRNDADLVLLLIHWGLENYSYPAPSQRQLAHLLIKAGADCIFGHHPHVLQGVESINGRAVAYSLGNFLFDHIPWRYINRDGNPEEQIITLAASNLEAGVLSITFSRNEPLPYKFVATRINEDGMIVVDDTSQRNSEIHRLSRPLKWFGYRFLWRLYALKREWQLRILPLFKGNITWQKLKKIRPKHFFHIFQALCRSVGITNDNNHNPYD